MDKEPKLIEIYELSTGHYRIIYGEGFFNDDPKIYQATWNGCGIGIKSHSKDEIYRLTKERIVEDAKKRRENLSAQMLEMDQIIKDFEAEPSTTEIVSDLVSHLLSFPQDLKVAIFSGELGGYFFIKDDDQLKAQFCQKTLFVAAHDIISDYRSDPDDKEIQSLVVS